MLHCLFFMWYLVPDRFFLSLPDFWRCFLFLIRIPVGPTWTSVSGLPLFLSHRELFICFLSLVPFVIARLYIRAQLFTSLDSLFKEEYWTCLCSCQWALAKKIWFKRAPVWNEFRLASKKKAPLKRVSRIFSAFQQTLRMRVQGT